MTRFVGSVCALLLVVSLVYAQEPGIGAAMAQAPTRSQQAQAAFGQLIAKAEAEGSVRVIVGFRLAFSAEGLLADEAQVQRQREAIA